MQSTELKQKEQSDQRQDDQKTDHDQLTDDYLLLYNTYNNDAP